MDITDLFSSVARTKVSPQKSYVSSYALTGSLADTGLTLNVANGQFYACTFHISGAGGTVTVNVLENGSIKETILSRAASGAFYFASKILQNTSGSTQTVKVQATSSAGGTLDTMSLICGSFIVGTHNTTTFPLNAYIQDFEACVSQPFTELPISVLNLSQAGQTTGTVSCTGLNVFVSGINISKPLAVTSQDSPAYVAFDFNGKTMAI